MNGLSLYSWLFLLKETTKNWVEQAANPGMSATHLILKLIIVFFLQSSNQWAESSLKVSGLQRHNKCDLRMCKNQKYVSPVVQSSDYVLNIPLRACKVVPQTSFPFKGDPSGVMSRGLNTNA